MRCFHSLNHYLQAGLYVGLDYGGGPHSGPISLFLLYGLILARQCVLWPHSRAGDCYVADLSVCISLMLLLSTAELGTESVAELRSGPATELGVASQQSWGLPYGRATGCFCFWAHN
jgi:hypothetical protein